MPGIQKNGTSEEHTQLINDTLLDLGKYCGHLGRFWRNETGLALNIRTEEKFRYGLVGSSDIIGFFLFNGLGVFVGFECKTGNAVQSKGQKNFQAMVQRFGGFYEVVRHRIDAAEFVLRTTGCNQGPK